MKDPQSFTGKGPGEKRYIYIYIYIYHSVVWKNVVLNLMHDLCRMRWGSPMGEALVTCVPFAQRLEPDGAAEPHAAAQASIAKSPCCSSKAPSTKLDPSL